MSTVTPKEILDPSNGAQVARLKVVVSANLPSELANRTIACEVVFDSESRSIKANEPLSMALMVDEDYAPYISAVLETCHVSIVPARNVARL